MRKFFPLIGLVILSSCVVVNPGYVGVKSTLGKLKPRVYQPGLISVNPLITE